MVNENSVLSIKAVAKLEKYPAGTTQEQIDKGLVQPEEIIISEDNILDKETIKLLLGGNA